MRHKSTKSVIQISESQYHLQVYRLFSSTTMCTAICVHQMLRVSQSGFVIGLGVWFVRKRMIVDYKKGSVKD